MNTGRRMAVASLVLALAPAAACAPDPDTAPAPLSQEEEAFAREAGGQAAVVLQTTLGPRILQAIEQDGPAEAMRFCSIAADSLTAEARETAGLHVTRTSTRYRNPDNAPDRSDAEALAQFEALAARGEVLPAGFVQAVSATEMRFYSPLQVGPVCMNCHGPADALAPGVRELLDERYPEDRATGYEVGDFRGLIRVSMPRQR